MEQEDSKGPSSSASTTSRWNPTKEQISVLEALYKQGIRTPTAEQIQQIAGKLREYGSIEGKNVFYWFQNHKARQRQKQKQESIACFNRFLRKASAGPPLLPQPIPLPPPACTNVVCSPYYFPQSNVGYYPQFQPVMLPGGMGSRVAPADFQRQEGFKERGGPTCNNYENYDTNTTTHETLQLFPLHPTGILEERCSTYTESYGVDGGGGGGV